MTYIQIFSLIGILLGMIMMALSITGAILTYETQKEVLEGVPEISGDEKIQFHSERETEMLMRGESISRNNNLK